MLVQVQYFQGCPNSEEMIRRVRKAIDGIKDIHYEEILIDTPELAQKLKFRGSPTLLIDGEDFEGLPEPKQASLSCRFYPMGLPTIEQIRQSILKKIY